MFIYHTQRLYDLHQFYRLFIICVLYYSLGENKYKQYARNKYTVHISQGNTMNISDPLYKYPNYNDVPKYSPLNVSGKWDSLYIPYVRSGEINAVVDALENKFAIGKVKNVDRKPRPKNGSDTEYFSLFIHFDYWFNSDFAIFLRYYLDKHGKYDISNYYRYYYKNQQSREDNFDFHILINRSSRPRAISDTHAYSAKPTHHQYAVNDASSSYHNINTPNVYYSHQAPAEDTYISFNEILRDNINEKAKLNASSNNVSTACAYSDDISYRLEKHERLIALLSDEIAALRELVYKHSCGK